MKMCPESDTMLLGSSSFRFFELPEHGGGNNQWLEKSSNGRRCSCFSFLQVVNSLLTNFHGATVVITGGTG
jgi:hypothetical protein